MWAVNTMNYASTKLGTTHDQCIFTTTNHAVLQPSLRTLSVKQMVSVTIFCSMFTKKSNILHNFCMCRILIIILVELESSKTDQVCRLVGYNSSENSDNNSDDEWQSRQRWSSKSWPIFLQLFSWGWWECATWHPVLISPHQFGILYLHRLSKKKDDQHPMASCTISFDGR